MDKDKGPPSHEGLQQTLGQQQTSNNGLDTRGPRTLAAKARPANRNPIDPDNLTRGVHIASYFIPGKRFASMPVLRRCLAIPIRQDGHAPDHWNRGYCNQILISKGSLDITISQKIRIGKRPNGKT